MKNHIIRFALLSLFFATIHYADAQERVRKYLPEEKNGWYGTIQVGRSLAFGDDSWNVFDDYKYAKGVAASLSIGKFITPVIGAQAKVRYLELKNRVNLEIYETFKDHYEYLPNRGFYDYKGIAMEAEATLNVTNLIKRHRSWDFFNIYLIAGGGANVTYWYDHDVIDNWDGTMVEGLVYNVDTRPHWMPVGVIGGMLDFRVDNDLSLNIEALGTFTGDLMEGVRYEESYDVYITISIGATIHF